ncbi:ATP synthase subunit I [Alteromonas sp. 5E99-2]|uniref:ATP synthase subunit I n=1 Tax=Alteromonas sp. 5E99-2 TaxID=2817683 RepID=UPI001F6104A0|nr:ATP synthase subunit I [Alteromonas sp. 5E99-2]
MTGKLKSIAIGKKIAKKGFVFQLVCSALLVAIATLFCTINIGLAVGYGAVISLLPNAVFSLFAFRYSGAQQAQAVARSFNQGSKIKLAITISLFVVAFAGLNLSPAPVFIGFIATTFVYWTVLFRTQ